MDNNQLAVIEVGDVVKLSVDAKQSNGKAIAKTKKHLEFVVSEINGNKASLTVNSVCVFIVELSDLVKVIDEETVIDGVTVDVEELVTADTERLVVKVVADLLNIRSEPGFDSEIVGMIKDRGNYTVVESDGDWYRLDGGIGWINKTYCKVD